MRFCNVSKLTWANRTGKSHDQLLSILFWRQVTCFSLGENTKIDTFAGSYENLAQIHVTFEKICYRHKLFIYNKTDKHTKNHRMNRFSTDFSRWYTLVIPPTQAKSIGISKSKPLRKTSTETTHLWTHFFALFVFFTLPIQSNGFERRQWQSIRPY